MASAAAVSPRSLPLSTGGDPGRGHWVRATLVTCGTVFVLVTASRLWPSLREISALLVLVVIYASFQGGKTAGTLSGVVAYGYFLYAFSERRLFDYDRGDIDRLICLAIVIPLAVALIDAHRRLQRRLLQAQAELGAYAQDLEVRVRQRTEALSASIRSLQEVNSTIAHDLRNPVRYIAGYAEIMAENPSEPAVQARQLARIRSNAALMDRLIGDLLRYTRLHELSVDLSPVSLDAVLAAVLRRLEADILRTGATVHRPASLPVVWANAELAEEVMAHLLANALAFTRAGVPPVIRFRAEPKPPGVRVAVEDNGTGIPLEFREKLFRPFHRLTPSESGGSTGIGLAIVARAMSQMGGAAGMESAAGHPGSVFWLQFLEPPTAG